MTTICLIRHGETDWNKQSLIQGQLDNPLNDTGRSQAIEAGKILKKYNPDWDVFISSPLCRARETAEIIAKELGFTKEIIIHKGFIERDFGAAEGQLIRKEIYDKIEADDVEDLEKSYDLQNRVYNAILDVAEKYPNQKVLIATHSHVIKGFFTKMSNEFTFTTRFKNLSFNFIEVENGEIINYIDRKEYE